MDADRLFVYTLSDLEQRVIAKDEYTVLMSAALLRKLLLDQNRLVDQVNARHKLDLRFRINGVSPYERFIHQNRPQFWAIGDALDPDSRIASTVTETTRDQFLARRVMSIGGEPVTVRDVIDHLANVAGAVHKGQAKKDRQRVVQAASDFFYQNGLSGAVSHVRLIAKITARGLSPLREAVIAAGDASWASVDSTGLIKLRDEDT